MKKFYQKGANDVSKQYGCCDEASSWTHATLTDNVKLFYYSTVSAHPLLWLDLTFWGMREEDRYHSLICWLCTKPEPGDDYLSLVPEHIAG